MMRLRQAPAIAMLILLAWAATASAECAWVLWGVTYEETRDSKRDRIIRESMDNAFGPQQKSTEPAPEPKYNVIWEPTSAHETMKMCYAAMGMAKELLPYVKYFKCLPDGTDPRGAKGGAR